MSNTLLKITAHDGYPLEVMLSTPDKNADKLVLFLQGSGPQTYNMKRQLPNGTFFHYHDLFENEFAQRGIAYCRFSTRGVKNGDTAPFFEDIDEEQYKKYLPHNSVSDAEAVVKHIKEEFPGISVYLLGWSEGSIIAPLVALNKNVEISGLLLCGYCNENLRDVLRWQLSGNGFFVFIRQFFDYDKKGYISKEDLEEDRYHKRAKMFGDASFEQLDMDGDGMLTAADFEMVDFMNEMFSAIERGDEEWLKKNKPVPRLTAAWFNEHFTLEPNREVLPRLDIPIHIFAGEYDTMTPEFYARDIERSFAQLGKTNLTVHYFEDHDHDLLYLDYVLTGTISAGIKCLLDVSQEL